MTIKQGCLNLPRKIIAAIESPSLSFLFFVLTFFSILTIRFFQEAFTQASLNYLNYGSMQLLLNLLHLYLIFSSMLISLSLLGYIATRVNIVYILRALMLAFIVLLLGPLIDYIYSAGTGDNMLYLQSLYSLPSHNLLYSFLYFFGKDSSITPGMRIEILLSMIAACIYFVCKGRSIFMSICYALLVYVVIFIYAALPLLASYIFSFAGLNYEHTAYQAIRCYLFIIFFTMIPLLYLANKNIFMEMIRDMRWLRLSHYVLMLVLGAALALSGTHENLYQSLIATQHEFVANFIFCIISLTCAVIFCIVSNNITDQGIDKISNQSRPLITGSIALSTYTQIGYWSLFASLVYALAADARALLLMSVLIAGYYLYSMPPIRFKRVLILSKFAIAMNSLAMILLGYILVQGDVKFFPHSVIVIVLAGFTLCANVIDVKDEAGDKVGGILTLPGLIGLKWSRILIGVMFVLTYTCFAWLFHAYYLPFFFAGLIQFYLINRKVFNEKLIFIFNLLSILLVIYLLLQ